MPIKIAFNIIVSRTFLRVSPSSFYGQKIVLPHVSPDHHNNIHTNSIFMTCTELSKQLQKMKKLTMIMLIFIIIFLNFPLRNSATSPIVPAMYVFGDSLLDNGNNNLLPTLVKANFQPYGMDFDRGATGRFTNGKTITDFISEFLELPYSPPFMSLERAVLRLDQLTGLNFASGSCGILPETGSHLGRCINFPEQISLFERIVQNYLPTHYQNPEDLSDYLSKSLYMITIGSNDYINNYADILQPYDHSRGLYTPQSFAEFLVHELSQQLQKLYQLGARKVIVFEVGPIGCIPSISRQFKHNGRCNEDVNQLAVVFNNQLSSMLQNLTSTLTNSDFILGHGYWLGYDAIMNPSNYGLSDSSTPCCITWLNGTATCIPELWAMACRNAEERYFWDGYHLTESIYGTIASLCFNGSSVCIPKNIQDLVAS